MDVGLVDAPPPAALSTQHWPLPWREHVADQTQGHVVLLTRRVAVQVVVMAYRQPRTTPPDARQVQPANVHPALPRGFGQRPLAAGVTQEHVSVMSNATPLFQRPPAAG